jgi:asparagine N-glycosylation enzyme membrane subunit Stt3
MNENERVKTVGNNQADFADVKTDGKAKTVANNQAVTGVKTNENSNFTGVNTEEAVKKVKIGKTVNIYQTDVTSAKEAFLNRLRELKASGSDETQRFIVGVSEGNNTQRFSAGIPEGYKGTFLKSLTPPPPRIHERLQ